MKEIGSPVFFQCGSLTRLAIPDGVTKIGSTAFAYNNGLVSISIPVSMEVIDRDAFHKCYNLKEIWYAGSKAQWQALMASHPSDPTEYDYHDALFEAVVHCTDGDIVPAGGSSPGSQTKPGQTENTDGAGQTGNQPAPGTFHTVGKYTYQIINQKEAAFQNPANQKTGSVTIPASVTIAGKSYKVTKIADKAFRNTRISKVKIGKNVKSIGIKAFYNCKNLSSVTIGVKVNKIGKQAFADCKSLKKITVKTTKLTAKNVGSKAFQGISGKAKFQFPKRKQKDYKKLFRVKGA